MEVTLKLRPELRVGSSQGQGEGARWREQHVQRPRGQTEHSVGLGEGCGAVSPGSEGIRSAGGGRARSG